MIWVGRRGKTLFKIRRSEISLKLAKALLKNGRGADAAVVASVVPLENKRLARIIQKITGAKVYFFPGGADGGIVIKPRPARGVGADRLANALGALSWLEENRKFTKNTTHAIIADVGTALTVDVVSLQKEFEGGLIAPGPRLGAKSLYEFTQKLPFVEFTKTTSPLGKTTKEAIEAGLWFGFRGLAQGCTRAMLERFRESVVFVTGGDGARCFEGSGLLYIQIDDLTHRGLAAAARNL